MSSYLVLPQSHMIRSHPLWFLGCNLVVTSVKVLQNVGNPAARAVKPAQCHAREGIALMPSSS